MAHESIRQTLARYNMAGDRLKATELAATFAEDGVIESDEFRYVTRKAIYDWFAGWSQSSVGVVLPARSPRFVRHHLTTCTIDVTGPQTAKMRTYWAVFTDIGPDHCGTYHDDFRKIGADWLIAHRKIRVDWRAPESYFRKAV